MYFIDLRHQLLNFGKKYEVIHIPINPVLDIYNNKIYSVISSIKKEDFYIYKKINKNDIILFGDNKHNFKNLKII